MFAWPQQTTMLEELYKRIQHSLGQQSPTMLHPFARSLQKQLTCAIEIES